MNLNEKQQFELALINSLARMMFKKEAKQLDAVQYDKVLTRLAGMPPEAFEPSPKLPISSDASSDKMTSQKIDSSKPHLKATKRQTFIVGLGDQLKGELAAYGRDQRIRKLKGAARRQYLKDHYPHVFSRWPDA